MVPTPSPNSYVEALSPVRLYLEMGYLRVTKVNLDLKGRALI